MANLSTKKTVKYIPSLPGNRELAEPLSFSITAGLSLMDLRAWRERLSEIKFDGVGESEIAKAFDVAFEGVASLDGSHTIDGAAVNTLGQYLSLVALQPGAPLMTELMGTINYNNSAEGLKEVFSVRSFGGTPTMAEVGK